MTTLSSKNSSVLGSLREIAADIKIAHSVFALPFALLASFMAVTNSNESLNWSQFTGQLVLIVLAMVFARTVAMLMNRLLDRYIDKDNPRTTDRALPSGRLSTKRAIAVILLCIVFFMTVCICFGLFYQNWWPAYLGLPVLAWISAYSMFKRFTSLCHLYLGSSLAISPIAAAIAINPEALNQPALWLLSLMVLFWVAGFDIIYALQDVEVDKEQGLFSIPSRLGTKRALWISRVLHLFAVIALVAIVILDPRMMWFFSIAVLLVIALLIYEHATVARWGKTKMALAFFTLNGIISCILGAAGILDVLL